MFYRILILVALCVYCKGTNNKDPIFRNDYKYYYEANGWFKLHIVPMSWAKARLICEYEGAVLVSPLNNQIQTGIAKFLTEHKSSPEVLFSGTSATFVPGIYQSIEGVRLEEMSLHWSANEPSQPEGCLVFYSNDGTMGIKKCSDQYAYICYKKYHQMETVRNDCGTTDKEYHHVNGSKECYKFHPERVNWEEAYKICYAEGGRLSVHVNSEVSEETLKRKDIPIVYMGFRLLNGIFWDIKGNVLVPYRSELFKSCGAQGWNGEFTSLFCNEDHAFLCEKDADYIV